MEYFKKHGRASDEEQAVINAIEKLIEEKGIPREEIPQCSSLDDLLQVQNLMEAYVPKQQTQAQPLEPVEEIEEQAEVPNMEETRFEEEQQEAPSEQELEESQESIEAEEQEIAEPAEEPILEEAPAFIAPDFQAEDYYPFEDEVKERSYNANAEGSHLRVERNDDEEVELKESSDTPVDNLNPNTKRRAAEQTAKAILSGYAKLAPQPFKWLAKIDEQKVEQMSFEGQIDINIEVSEGMTFDDYVKQTNEQVDEIFEVQEETLDEIREPLIEVLMEQEMELTPQQRLTMAVVSHLFQMLTVALKLRKQNNRILEYQKQLTNRASFQRA